MARTPPSRISAGQILSDLRLAARKGDRTALSLALDQMRTLAHTPRYWERYLGLLRNPLARLVDLLVVKQGERIAHQKGWKLPRPAPPGAGGRGRRGAKKGPPGRRRRAGPVPAAVQPSLFWTEGATPPRPPRWTEGATPPRPPRWTEGATPPRPPRE